MTKVKTVTAIFMQPGAGTRLTLTGPFVKTRYALEPRRSVAGWCRCPTEWGGYRAQMPAKLTAFSRSLLVVIILAALVVRLIGIDQPFVDPWSWRQSDVAAIARNFLENGFHFTRPQIDWAGNEPGFVGTEFPILPFLAALFYKSAGVEEWIGRLQGVLLFVAALPFFFGIVRRTFGESAANWAAFFYAFAPLSIVASRAFMPDE